MSGEESSSPFRVLVADDEATVRERLPKLLEHYGPIRVIDSVAGGREAVAALRRDPSIELALIDVDMPGTTGIEAARQITEQLPGVVVVLLTAHPPKDFLQRALAAGAHGFLTKSMPPESLVRELVRAMDGKTVMSPSATELLAEQVRQMAIQLESDPEFTVAVNALSGTLRDVFDQLTRAMPTKAISSALGLTEGTVRVYVSRILNDTGCADRTQLVLRAAQAGLTAPSGHGMSTNVGA